MVMTNSEKLEFKEFMNSIEDMDFANMSISETVNMMDLLVKILLEIVELN